MYLKKMNEFSIKQYHKFDEFKREKKSNHDIIFIRLKYKKQIVILNRQIYF